MSVVLRLDAKALAELFKNDEGEVKLEVLQGVIDEFSRRHLKTLVNSSMFALTLDRLRREIKEELNQKIASEIATIREEVTSTTWGAKRLVFELRPELKQIIGDHIREVISEKIKEAATAVLNDLTAHLPSMINDRVEAEIHTQVRAEISQRVQSAINNLNNGQPQP
jgi:actin-like ATPase involved in cell morphogenesis